MESSDVSGAERNQSASYPNRDQETNRAPDKRDDGTLNQYFHNDVAATCADRGMNREFSRARRAPRGKEIG